MPPIYGRCPKPLEPLEIDRRTVAELARVLAERLAQLDAFGGRCKGCHDAEASAVLARLRRVLDAIDRGDLGGVD